LLHLMLRRDACATTFYELFGGGAHELSAHSKNMKSYAYLWCAVRTLHEDFLEQELVNQKEGIIGSGLRADGPLPPVFSAHFGSLR